MVRVALQLLPLEGSILRLKVLQQQEVSPMASLRMSGNYSELPSFALYNLIIF